MTSCIGCISAADNGSTGANRVHLEPALHGPGRPLPTGEGLGAAGGLNDTAEDGAAAGPPDWRRRGASRRAVSLLRGGGAGDLASSLQGSPGSWQIRGAEPLFFKKNPNCARCGSISQHYLHVHHQTIDANLGAGSGG